MNQKILITGGAGFIGCHLAKYILSNESKVELYIMDNLLRGRLDTDFEEITLDPRVTFINGDLTDFNVFSKLPTDIEYIYHLAAINGTRFFYEIPHEVLRINVLSIINILEWIKTFTKKPKFLFTSSNEAYAGSLEAFKNLPIPTPENVPLVLSDVFNPRWSYGSSKLIGESFAVHYANHYLIPTIIVRPHNFYGPRAGSEHVIPELFIKMIKKTDPFKIYSPSQTRSFCYITDAVEAMCKLMNDQSIFDNKVVDIFHIGSNKETSIQELVNKMFKVANWKPNEIIVKPALPGSVERRLPDVSKIKSVIKWESKTSLEDGLKKTFEWYKMFN